MEIDRATFDEQRDPRFGRANPERMRLSFWESMVREGHYPTTIRRRFGMVDDEGGPIWCFNRMGQTETEMADGRTICVAGEHEDSGDRDFFIYNDVIVLRPDGEVEVYGYPKDLFPPTDFHTASLVKNRIALIGSAGYPADRFPGLTPVWSLDLSTYRIEPILTHGDPPGWIFKHEANPRSGGDQEFGLMLRVELEFGP